MQHKAEQMYSQAIDYFHAIKAVVPITSFFAADATIVSHKLGLMTAIEYEHQLLETPADIARILVCEKYVTGNLLSLYVQLNLRSGIELQYVDLFEFDHFALIKRLYISRVSPGSFNGSTWLIQI